MIKPQSLNKERRFFMLPTNPMILLSYVNTQLRDNFVSLDDMCKAMSGGKVTSSAVLKEKLITDLKKIDYEYDATLNRFV